MARPMYSMVLLVAKPMTNHPKATNGEVTKMTFFLPKYPDRAPPNGENTMPEHGV